MVSIAQAATTVQVGSCVTGLTSYATIGAAVSAVAADTTIDVCPGTYPEQVVIKKRLTLTGVQSGSSAAAVVVPPSSGLVANVYDIYGDHNAVQIAVLDAASVTISNLTVDGSGNGLSGCGTDIQGIYFQNSTGTISNNAVRNQILTGSDLGCQDGLAINVESNGGTPAVTIKDNSVRNYQKNGITASGLGSGAPGPKVTVTGNTVIGIGATPAIAQNGIQIGFGATAKVTDNYVADDVYTGGYWASSGILIYASAGVTASSNTAESAQYSITTDSDPTYGVADGATISSNHIGGGDDAIDLCSNNNSATSNTVYGSTQDGIHSDDTCSSGAVVSGNNNTITGNTINEACAGILLGTGTGTTSSPNTFYNVTNTTLAGDACPAATGEAKASGSSHKALRPSPRGPNRN
ncbi:MAG: hypothetical protein WAL71_12610 [Terriglobales bacterium]|jgi:hypothetical protein